MEKLQPAKNSHPSTTKKQNRNKNRPLIFVLFLFFILQLAIFDLDLVCAQQLPQLYIDPAQISANPGQNFIARIKIGAGDCINTIKANVSFSGDNLELIDFSQGDSIISLWIDPLSRAKIAAANKTGYLSFSGGIPGGFCYRQNANSGENNKIAELIFKKKSTDQSEINILESSQIFLNDGQGTSFNITAAKATVAAATTTTNIADEWTRILKNDIQPPDQFEIKIYNDPAIFENKHFIVFFTQDKQTGIDRFEISETPLNDPKAKDNWVAGNSPYLLKDQSLRSKIKVKVYDLAGNEIISEYSPESQEQTVYENQILAFCFTVLLLAIGLLVWKLKKTK